MSVKITLTVDYKDVPKEADSIILRALSKLDSAVQCLHDAKNTEDLNKKLQYLDEARQKLVLADSNMEDSFNIILGYAKHELELKNNEQSIKNE